MPAAKIRIGVSNANNNITFGSIRAIPAQLYPEATPFTTDWPSPNSVKSNLNSIFLFGVIAAQ
jgi:hypothetical protein